MIRGPLGFGGASLPGLYTPIPAAQAHATVLHALASGVTHFDVAPRYGLGEAERRLGAVLATVPRDRFTLSTKVGWDVSADDRWPDFSREGVARSLAASRERMKLDFIDLAFVHDPDNHERAAADEVLPALAALRQSGAIGAIGVGMNDWPMLERFVTSFDLDWVMLAGRYTLLEQGALPLLTACQRRGVRVMLAGVFNSGVLASGAKAKATYNYRAAPPEVLERVAALERVCARFDVPLTVAALRFAMAHPAVALAVVGMETPERVDGNLAALTANVPDDLWLALRAEGLIADEAPTPDTLSIS
jgi:D-threo-aldose 1-dehydrogenase